MGDKINHLHLTKEHFRGKSGGGGFKATVVRQEDRRDRGIGVLLKGGLGDIHSVSLEPLAEAIVRASDGEIIAATLSTRRPFNPLDAIAGSFDSRQARSKSFHNASKEFIRLYNLDVLVGAGQSQGGITAVDAAHHAFTSVKDTGYSARTGVITIDTPGVYGPFQDNMPLIHNAVKLGVNCAEDLLKMSVREWGKLAIAELKHPVSLWEALYITDEISYLRDNIDISDKIEDLRHTFGVPVNHVFHYGDMVPGAEVVSEFSTAFEGAHVRVLWEPEPVACYMAKTIMENFTVLEIA